MPTDRPTPAHHTQLNGGAEIPGHASGRKGSDSGDNVQPTSESDNARQLRLRLIVAKVIYPTRRGYVDFALPYLREYLREHAAADM